MCIRDRCWGVNRRFQAKLAKSKNLHIIKPSAPIPAKFCTVIKITKCPSWVVPTHALQIQDGGRPPSWKNRKIVISQPRFERFWQNLASRCSLTLLTISTVKNLKFQKSKMAADAILKNWKIAISRPWFDRFWRNLARWCISNLLNGPTVKSLKLYKSKMAAEVMACELGYGADTMFHRTYFLFHQQCKLVFVYSSKHSVH